MWRIRSDSVSQLSFQFKVHDKEWAVQWLGEALAGGYLEKVEHVRWPQEGVSRRDMELVFMQVPGPAPASG